MNDPALQLVAVSIGNTTMRFGRFEGSEMGRSLRAPNALFDQAVDQVAALIDELPADGSDGPAAAVVVASVNEPVCDRLFAALAGRTGRTLYRLGRDLPILLPTALADDATPGQDRLLNALAAFEHLKQACVVVDCGTAVTVDFIDGQGVFQGGAIAPGAAMQLRALHELTAALPAVPLAAPDAAVFGKNTAQSMLNGVFYGVRGTVRLLVERYAEAYEAYPPVVVTGGDAPLIFDGDELIDRIIPDLTLWGVEAACRRALAAGALEPDEEG